MTAIVAFEGLLAKDAVDESRCARLASFAAALALHAAVLAAAVAGPAGERAETDPKPLLVELVVETPGPAADAGDAPGVVGGAGRPAAAVPAQAVTEPSVANDPAPLPQPQTRPRDADSRSRPAVPAAQRRAIPAARPVPASQPVARKAATNATAEPPSKFDAAPVAPGPIDAGEAFVAFLNTAAGSALPPGADGGGSTGHGGSSGAGAIRGPGFSPGTTANPMPPYPPAARRRSIEGTVLLQVQVSADGQALQVDIARSSGSALLDEAARETISRWRFRPAKRGDEAIAGTAFVPVQFSLLER